MSWRKKQESVLNDINELLKNYNDLASTQEYITLSFPNEPNISQVLNTLNGLGKINNILIKSLSFQINIIKKDNKQPAYVQNLGALGISMAVTGSYDNLKNFVRQVEQNVRIMDVVQFGLSEEKSQANLVGISSSTNVYNFPLNIKAYFQDPSTSASAIPKNNK